MKINKKKKYSNKKLLITILVIILSLGVISAASWYIVTRNEPPTSPSKSINYDPPTNEQVSEGQSIKQESLNNGSTQNDTPADIEVTITAKGLSEGNYRIRTFINNISNVGSCNINLTSGDIKLNNYQTVKIQALPEGSTCLGFDIPVKDLSAAKNWKAVINYTSNGSTGTATTEFTL